MNHEEAFADGLKAGHDYFNAKLENSSVAAPVNPYPEDDPDHEHWERAFDYGQSDAENAYYAD